jgi:hypothetical protein
MFILPGSKDWPHTEVLVDVISCLSNLVTKPGIRYGGGNHTSSRCDSLG